MISKPSSPVQPLRLIRNTSPAEIKNYAVKKGMTTLWDDVIEKFISGITTIEEVFRVTSSE